MRASIFEVCCLILICTVAYGQETGNEIAEHLTRIPGAQENKHALDIELLFLGKPLVGVVEEGESRLVHFGVLPRGQQFPDIIIYLEAVEPEATVDVYCSSYERLNDGRQPDGDSAAWRSTKHGEVFISSRSLHYRESIVDRIRYGEKVKVAAFGCAIRGNADGSAKFQLTVQLSFDERTLHQQQQAVMKEIYSQCCKEEKRCHRWHLREQTMTSETDDEVEFDFCHRTGSFCNAKGDLVRLDLRGYGLKCELPKRSLLKLPTLESLDLSENQIHADVVEDLVSLGGLRHLKDLAVASNLIYGEMNVDGVCSKLVKNLRTLDLDDNVITGRLPVCLFTDMLALEEIYLSRNHFSGYISDLFPTSSSLKALSLSENELMGTLPESLGRLSSLKVLYLNGNAFSGEIPSSFMTMRNLEVLDMSNNRLSAFPSKLFANWIPPAALKVLKLQNNKLHGEMPETLLRATSVSWMDMSDNYLSGPLIARDGMFPRMTYFNVSNNELSGPIPEAYVSMALFGEKRRTGPRHVFDVSFNKLDGPIPEFMYHEVTPSIMDTELYMGGNRLTCHPWKTLNYIPNFECFARDGDKTTAEEDLGLLESEARQRELISALNQGDYVAVNSVDGSLELQAQPQESSGENSTANVIVGLASGVLGVIVLVGVIALVVKYKRNRDRRLGLQYGAADDIDSHDGYTEAASSGDPGPSQAPGTQAVEP